MVLSPACPAGFHWEILLVFLFNMDSSPLCQARPRAAPAGNLWSKLDEISSNDVWTLRRQVIQPFFFNFLFLVIQPFLQFLFFGDPTFFSIPFFGDPTFFLQFPIFGISPVVRLQVQLNTRWKSCKKVFSECKKLEDRALGYVARFPNILDMMTILLLYLKRIVLQGFLISWIEGQFSDFTWAQVQNFGAGIKKKAEGWDVIKSDN